MNSTGHTLFSRFWLAAVLAGTFFLFGISVAQADITLFTTDQDEWLNAVSNVEVFTTRAANVALAGELDSVPGNDEVLGTTLTYKAGIELDDGTIMSRGFQLGTMQTMPLSEFVFNDDVDAGASDDWVDALSVGDANIAQNDNWTLDLLDNASMTAFGVVIRNSRNMIGETITLHLVSENEMVEILDLEVMIDEIDQSGNIFIGIISDTAFDSVVFDENSDEDDIAIADFHFEAIFSEPLGTQICSTLGDNRYSRYLDYDIFRFNGTEGENIAITLEADALGKHTGERVTLILRDRIRNVRFFRIDRSNLPNEIAAVLPATGEYRIVVAEQPRFVRGEQFSGDYCLTLESSEGASETLDATRWVE